MLPSIHQVLGSTSLCYLSYIKYLGLPVCVTFHTSSTWVCQFVLPSIHQVLGSASLCYLPYIKCLGLPVCVTFHTSSTWVCQFVLPSIHQVLGSASLCYLPYILPYIHFLVTRNSLKHPALTLHTINTNFPVLHQLMVQPIK